MMRISEIEKLAGQMIICGVEGEDTDASIRGMVEKSAIGGIILMGRNCKDSDRMHHMVKRLQDRSETPLLVGIDQEGGRVLRLKEDRFLMPSAREMAGWSEKLLLERAYLLGERMSEAGINLDFAPVLDVDTNPDNPVIGDRSFGDNPQEVYRLAAIFAKGLKDAGIIPCFKHFPGHGDTSSDSHLELPYVDHDAQRLAKIELAPFRAAIADSADMIMTAHVVYKAFDPELPATFSNIIVEKLLREKLGYDGVVISDDLQMKAVSDNYDINESARLLLKAGVDIALISNSYKYASELHRALVRLVEDNEAMLERMQASVGRIERLKEKWKLAER